MTTTASNPEVVVDDPKITSKEAGRAICEVFGIDSHSVRSITLKIVAGSPAMLTVEKFIRRSELEGMTATLQEFVLAKEVKTNDDD